MFPLKESANEELRCFKPWLCSEFLAAPRQLYERSCPSVCPSYLFTMFMSLYHHEIFTSYYHWQKWCPCNRSRSAIKGRGHRCQSKFAPNRVFSNCNFILNSQMATEYNAQWRSIEDLPYCFLGHPSNFKVSRAKKSTIGSRIEHFRTVTPIGIHRLLRNNPQSLKRHGRGALLHFLGHSSNFKVTRAQNGRFGYDLNISGR